MRRSTRPNRLSNLLLPKSREHKRKISESLRRHHAKVRAALAAQEAEPRSNTVAADRESR